MDYRDIITIEPGKQSGHPCIRGLRMTVQNVLEYLALGMTEEEILDDFPDPDSRGIFWLGWPTQMIVTVG